MKSQIVHQNIYNALAIALNFVLSFGFIMIEFALLFEINTVISNLEFTGMVKIQNLLYENT